MIEHRRGIKFQKDKPIMRLFAANDEKDLSVAISTGASISAYLWRTLETAFPRGWYFKKNLRTLYNVFWRTLLKILFFIVIDEVIPLLIAFYAGLLYQQDGHGVIDIVFLLFPLDKGHVPEYLWYLSVFCYFVINLLKYYTSLHHNVQCLLGYR